jgi:hypothetical protein
MQLTSRPGVAVVAAVTIALTLQGASQAAPADVGVHSGQLRPSQNTGAPTTAGSSVGQVASPSTAAPKATARAGIIALPKLTPPVPLVLINSRGKRVVIKTNHASKTKAAAGGYVLMAQKAVSGHSVSVANEGYIIVYPGKTTRPKIVIVANEGSLRVAVVSLPRGSGSPIRVSGPHGFKTDLGKSTTLRHLRPGIYRVSGASANLKASPGVALAMIDRQRVELKAGSFETVTVDYSNRTSVRTITDLSGQHVSYTLPPLSGPGTWDGSISLAGIPASSAPGDAVILGPSATFPIGYVGVITAVDGGSATAKAVPLPDLIPDLHVSIKLSRVFRNFINPREEFASLGLVRGRMQRKLQAVQLPVHRRITHMEWKRTRIGVRLRRVVADDSCLA